MELEKITILVRKVKKASFALATLPTEAKNAALFDLADALIAQVGLITRENAKDVSAAKGLGTALIDRLVLDEGRIRAMADAVRDVAKLPDPVGEVVESYERNGLRVRRVRVPLGVICMIYESRPNVTIDAASLCFKAGNAVILRGGSEAFHSSKALIKIMGGVLKKRGLDPYGAVLVPDTDRKTMSNLLKLDKDIDLVIPRGGPGLMKFIRENTRIPVVKHDKGVCSIFVDESVLRENAVDVVVNAKTSRPGVCNALETLYVHEKIADTFLPELGECLMARGVEIRGDAGVRKILKTAKKAVEADWSEEYLDLVIAIKIVKDVQDAVTNIRKYYSRHTESILTEDRDNAAYFLNSLDSSCVMHNTSTRFNDGGELGLGAEIGISTTKLHAYGPMGLRELTIAKFMVESDYKIRK